MVICTALIALARHSGAGSFNVRSGKSFSLNAVSSQADLTPQQILQVEVVNAGL
jgi:hypothetical protein